MTPFFTKSIIGSFWTLTCSLLILARANFLPGKTQMITKDYSVFIAHVIFLIFSIIFLFIAHWDYNLRIIW